MFAIDIGLTAADASGIFSDPSQPVWIEVADLCNGKTYPRQRYSLVPYALRVPIDTATLE